MQDHVILNYLDQPLKFLIWPASTLATVAIPAGLLILLGYPVRGVFVGIAIAFGIREYKRRFGEESLIGVLYWILPHGSSHMPMTPPSYIREYIG